MKIFKLSLSIFHSRDLELKKRINKSKKYNISLYLSHMIVDCVDKVEQKAAHHAAH